MPWSVTCLLREDVLSRVTLNSGAGGHAEGQGGHSEQPQKQEEGKYGLTGSSAAQGHCGG